MTGYTKLFASIVTSTIWSEDDTTRILWITMLALADQHGHVAATVPGLARIAGISVEDTLTGIGRLLAADQFSRTTTNEGRRVEEVEGGYLLLNHAKYRDCRNGEERKTYMRGYMRNARGSSCKQSVNNVNSELTSVNNVNPELTSVNSQLAPLAKAEAEAEAYTTSAIAEVPQSDKPTRAATTKSVTDEAFLAELSQHYPDIEVARELRKMDAWISTRPGKQKTRRFIVNWLNKVETPVKTTKQEDSKWTF